MAVCGKSALQPRFEVAQVAELVNMNLNMNSFGLVFLDGNVYHSCLDTVRLDPKSDNAISDSSSSIRHPESRAGSMSS